MSLSSVGMRKVEIGAIAKAKRIGEELLELSNDYKDDWAYGNVVHKANLILGRVALREGNLDLAGDYLLEAGRTPGSPQLDSFGPNMTLAKELLEAGRKDVVIKYFRLCDNFWELGAERLTYWARLVNHGQIPNFGGNLLY